jgi:hypothetical protein
VLLGLPPPDLPPPPLLLSEPLPPPLLLEPATTRGPGMPQVARAGIEDLYGVAGAENSSGDKQKKLDVVAVRGWRAAPGQPAAAQSLTARPRRPRARGASGRRSAGLHAHATP